MEDLVTLCDVSKKYQRHILLEQIQLQIKKGDSIGITGHNGIGKSTLLKIIGKLVTYDTGSIQYMSNLKIGYVPEHFPKLNMTPFDYINNMAQILGLNKVDAKRRSEELFETFYMSSMMETPIKYLSKGSKQKVAVLQAMLRKPDLLLLDEPLSGQDSDSQAQFIHMVKQLNQEGTAIVMSCHEKWLMDTLAAKIYEISNKTLVIKEDV